MYRKFYPRIGLLAGLLAIVMMTTISTSAEAKGDVSERQKAAEAHLRAADARPRSDEAPQEQQPHRARGGHDDRVLCAKHSG